MRPGLLYLGTEASVYVSFDDGDRWQRFHTNLPPAPMYGLVVQEHFNDLVVGTYGRGYWILDDVTPLQQLTPEVAASAAHLFAPRPAYRFQPISAPFTMFDDQSDGENPPYGASLNYWLAEATDDGVTVEIANAAGEVVRTLEGTANAGVNRVWWDLMNEPVEQVRLRTKPLHGPGHLPRRATLAPVARGTAGRPRRRHVSAAAGHVHGDAQGRRTRF